MATKPKPPWRVEQLSHTKVIWCVCRGAGRSKADVLGYFATKKEARDALAAATRKRKRKA